MSTESTTKPNSEQTERSCIKKEREREKNTRIQTRKKKHGESEKSLSSFTFTTFHFSHGIQMLQIEICSAMCNVS